jgi:4-carboxymuconolactone decarboxylase
MPHSDQRYEAGLRALDEIDGPAGRQVVASLEQVAPDLARFIVEFGFGEVYSRPGLDRRSREITTIATLTALGGCEPQLSVHVGAGLNVGLTPGEIIETITHTCFYAGFPRSINAVRVAQRVFADRGIRPEQVRLSRREAARARAR